MLPKLSGTDACREIRARSDVPIIMLTARDAEREIVEGLGAGADDYVTKPFSAAELVGRIRSLLRRREIDRNVNGQIVQRVGGITIDLVNVGQHPHRGRAHVRGADLHLAPEDRA
jgi:DNA-binding response OmpR family regulator